MNELPLAWEVLLFLAGIAVLAGFLDTLAGGGGLIALPALLMAGVPPLAALGTNKLQGSFGTAMASAMMFRSGRVAWRSARWLMVGAFAGSIGGSVAVQFVDSSVLGFVIPLVLVGTASYFLLAPRAKARIEDEGSESGLYRYIAVPVIGWYDGMFGPGTGSFFALAGVQLRKWGLIDATAMAKALNFATNLAALLVFLWAGQVVWVAGGVMIAGQLAGAWMGSHCLLRVDPGILRWIVVAVCLTMLGRYGMTQGWW